VFWYFFCIQTQWIVIFIKNESVFNPEVGSRIAQIGRGEMKKLLVVFVVLALLIAGPAYADLFGFYNISNNSGVAEALAGQLYVDVNPYVNDDDPGVLFDFYNGGTVPGVGQISDPITAFINEIYFDYPPYIFTSGGPLNVNNTGTVEYKFGADPENLPGGASLGFYANLGFEPTTEGANQNGIDVNEKLGVFFGGDFDVVIEAIRSEAFQIGLHVKGIDTVGGSDSFINNPNSPNPVPEPATILLLGSGLLGFATARRKKYFKK
jgi:hypothetical protein